MNGDLGYPKLGEFGDYLAEKYRIRGKDLQYLKRVMEADPHLTLPCTSLRLRSISKLRFTYRNVANEYKLFYFYKYYHIFRAFPDKFHLAFSQTGKLPLSNNNQPLDKRTLEELLHATTVGEAKTIIHQHILRINRDKISLRKRVSKICGEYSLEYFKGVVNDYLDELADIFPGPIYDKVVPLILWPSEVS